MYAYCHPTGTCCSSPTASTQTSGHSNTCSSITARRHTRQISWNINNHLLYQNFFEIAIVSKWVTKVSKCSLQGESEKSSTPKVFWHFFQSSWEIFVQILHAYYMFLSTLDCKILFNCLQLWRSYAILSATTIICSKCPPSAETHAGRSHLIWHNFITVWGNWIKICILV